VELDLKALLEALAEQDFALRLQDKEFFMLVAVAVQAIKKVLGLLVAVMVITLLAHKFQQLLVLQAQVVVAVVVEILVSTLAATAVLASSLFAIQQQHLLL
jgi:hypothetical protein